MCQKAYGVAFAANVFPQSFKWTRGGDIRRFNSSDRAARGFCVNCGTPLTFESNGQLVALLMGTFDTPEHALLQPTEQHGITDRLGCVASVHSLRESMEVAGRDVLSWQHPDHDTDGWQPA